MRRGSHHTEETKRKISENHKGVLGMFHSKETKTKMSEAQKGRIISKEHRIKISETLKGRKLSDEHKKALSKARKGKTLSEEHKTKISESHKGKKLSEETKRKIGESRKGLKPSEETRRKMSKSQKGRKTSEKTREKIAISKRGRNRTEETKRKISDALKGNKNAKGCERSKEFREKCRRRRLKQIFPKKDTSIEVILHQELDKRKIMYEKHIAVCGICQPDIVFLEQKTAVFADGRYWHSKDFRNGRIWRRDRHQEEVLQKNGWIPLRFWGNEIRNNVSSCVDQIVSALEDS